MSCSSQYRQCNVVIYYPLYSFQMAANTLLYIPLSVPLIAGKDIRASCFHHVRKLQLINYNKEYKKEAREKVGNT